MEAFDRTGRVLNIVVTRSDGKAPPLLCNYLTTPNLLVYSASLASCAIPGIFEAVELMAKARDGAIVPYFITGGHRWTDGGCVFRPPHPFLPYVAPPRFSHISHFHLGSSGSKPTCPSKGSPSSST